MALPGEKRLKTACLLTVGTHALEIEAFVMRKPEENQQQLYALLLQRNARMYAVSWSMDDTGDIYLTGRIPLGAVSADEMDRVLGCVLDYADGTFNTMLEIGLRLLDPPRVGLAGQDRRLAGEPAGLQGLR